MRPKTSPASIFWWATTACSRGSTSCTTARNSPRLAAANISAGAARRSAAGTVSVLDVANDNDFWDGANIVIAKSGGGEPATKPPANLRPLEVYAAEDVG